MGNKEYIESGGIDESADEGDDKYEENALYADRIVPMLTDIGAHDDLPLGCAHGIREFSLFKCEHIISLFSL